jgi:hypothetical protein
MSVFWVSIEREGEGDKHCKGGGKKKLSSPAFTHPGKKMMAHSAIKMTLFAALFFFIEQ